MGCEYNGVNLIADYYLARCTLYSEERVIDEYGIVAVGCLIIGLKGLM